MTSTAQSSRSRTRHTGAAAAALTAAAALLAGCSSDDDPDNPLAGEKAEAGTVVVGSNNFAESTLLADIYGEALRAKGLKVTYKHNIGSRETTYGLMKNGSITVLPEYNGSLLAYLDPEAGQESAQAVNEAVKAKLDKKLTLLESSPAENKDSVSVNAETAKKHGLTLPEVKNDDPDDHEGRIVCKCFGVTDLKILRVARENNLHHAAEITNYCKAGGACGACLGQIQRLLDDMWKLESLKK